MERFTLSLDTELAKEFDAQIAERGVRHGKLNLVSVEIGQRRLHGYKPRGYGRSNHHAYFKLAR